MSEANYLRRVPGFLGASLACCFISSAEAVEIRPDLSQVGDRFGNAVSVSGNSVLVGSPGMNFNTGTAYLFDLIGPSSNEFSVAAELNSLLIFPGAELGGAVSLSGRNALVGAPLDSFLTGTTFVFGSLPTDGSEVFPIANLFPVSGVLLNFGTSVSIDGDIGIATGPSGLAFIAGIPLYQGLSTLAPPVGSVAVLTYGGGLPGDGLGRSVSISGTTGIASRINLDGLNGAVYVYYNLDTAIETVYSHVILRSSQMEAEAFGTAVSLSGSRAIVGAPHDDIGVGSVFLYEGVDVAAPGDHYEAAKLTPSSGVAEGEFGSSLSISNKLVLIGAPAEDHGAAYLYLLSETMSGVVVEDIKIVASNGQSGDRFGHSVSIDGDIFAIGAPRDLSASGSVYIGTASSLSTLDVGNATRTISSLSFKSRINWVIGDGTSGNRVILSQGDLAKVYAPGSGVFIGRTDVQNNQLDIHGEIKTNFVRVEGTNSALYLGPTGKVTTNPNDFVSIGPWA